MRVGEAGHQRGVPQVHHPRVRAGGGEHLVARARGEHLAAAHRERLGQRARGVERPHAAATYTVVSGADAGDADAGARRQPGRRPAPPARTARGS